MEQANNNVQNDVIDLRELFSVLKRRKKLIWAITILITTLAIVYAFFVAKPLYEVKVMMELGHIDTNPEQKNPNNYELKEKLEVIFNVKNRGNTYPNISKIILPKKTKNIMVIQAQGRDNISAEKKLKEFINYLMDLQNKELSIYTMAQHKQLTNIKNEIVYNKQLIEIINKSIINYEEKLLTLTEKDAALAGIYAIEIGRKQTESNTLIQGIYSLNNQYNDLEILITPLKIHKPKIIGKIKILNKPIKPKKALIVIVSFIAALILSILLAFFLEFISTLKKSSGEDTQLD